MILPSVYFGPAFYYSLLVKLPNCKVEVKEHFLKQSYRNRCEIYGANGKLKLVVPLKKWKNRTLMKEIEISNDEDWQANHWKSICSAYRSSPYFEFYEEELAVIFKKQFRFLIDLNHFAEQRITELLNIKKTTERTDQYIRIEGLDYRELIHPKKDSFWSEIEFPNYMQVFENKYGFIKNLSILDILFNLGPNSLTYLENIELKDGKKD